MKFSLEFFGYLNPKGKTDKFLDVFIPQGGDQGHTINKLLQSFLKRFLLYFHKRDIYTDFFFISDNLAMIASEIPLERLSRCFMGISLENIAKIPPEIFSKYFGSSYRPFSGDYSTQYLPCVSSEVPTRISPRYLQAFPLDFF